MRDTRMEIDDREGKVVVRFVQTGDDGGEGRLEFLLDPEQAREKAEALARACYKARFGVDLVPNGQSAVSRVVRDQMVNRVSHIIRSLTEQHKPRIFIAESAVDAVLAKAGL